MFLSEYWKRLEENFWKRLFLRFPKKDENYKKKPLALFNLLKEPLLVQKQPIHQRKALDLSFNLTPQKWAWHYQGAATPSRREEHILLNFMGFWLLVFYEISRTPFLSYSHFQGVKLKLILRAFCWCIVCFFTSIGSFQIFNSKIFRNILLHPVNKLLECLTMPAMPLFDFKLEKFKSKKR